MFTWMKFFDWKFLPSQIMAEDQALMEGVLSIAGELGLFQSEQDNG